MAAELSEPLGDFESWFPHRVAQAVEAGDVPADLLSELHAEFDAARELPQEEGRARALADLAERLEIPLDRAEAILMALEAQPSAVRDLLLR